MQKVTPQELKDMGFEKYANFLIDSRNIALSITSDSGKTGHVYLWIESYSETSLIVYVGKAGKRMIDRCRQHLAGFKSSTTGKAHAARLYEGNQQGKQYAIYVRKSDEIELFGEKISMFSAEEEALIKKLNPTWNSKI